MQLQIISIGTLAQNTLWGEKSPVRTGHATTSLITSGKTRLLVDPGLPAQVLIARLGERANVRPEDITDVFLTTFHPDTRRAIRAFESANWWIAPSEREAIGVPLAHQLARLSAVDGADEHVKGVLEQDVAVLQRCQPAPDRLADRVSLFPLPGVTPGLSGLLIEDARHTTLICGDAIPTYEHLERGQILSDAMDLDRARESFTEAIEIADLLVLGRDNLVVNPAKRPF